MFRPAALVALLCLSASAANAASLAAPASVRQGEPFFVVVTDAPAGSSVSILYADGSAGPAFPLYDPPRPALDTRMRYLLDSEFSGSGSPAGWRTALRRSRFALAAVPMDAAAGAATLRLTAAGGALASTSIMVAKRDFPRETIVLTPSLTSLRTEPDPRKDEQAKRYLALMASADPAAVFLTSGLLRPVAGNRQTSSFGHQRVYRYSTGGSATSVHNGLDYGYPTGTPVRAAGAGRVVMAEDRIATGNTVVVEHLPGVFTIYMHLSAMSVAAGERVGAGDPIGAVGATGLATGPHLHWELRVAGIACDPEALIGLDKIPPIRTILDAIEGG